MNWSDMKWNGEFFLCIILLFFILHKFGNHWRTKHLENIFTVTWMYRSSNVFIFEFVFLILFF
jgi:hypothetical protein